VKSDDVEVENKPERITKIHVFLRGIVTWRVEERFRSNDITAFSIRDAVFERDKLPSLTSKSDDLEVGQNSSWARLLRSKLLVEPPVLLQRNSKSSRAFGIIIFLVFPNLRKISSIFINLGVKSDDVKVEL
jgi:hypothetical protein